MERGSIHTTDSPTVYMFPRIVFVGFVFRSRTTPLSTVLCASAYVCTQNTRSFHSNVQFSVSIDKSQRKQLQKVHRNDSSISLILIDPMIRLSLYDKHSNELFQEILFKRYFSNVTLSFISKTKINISCID